MKNRLNFLLAALVAGFSLSASACPIQEATMQHSAAMWLFFVPVTFVLCIICTIDCSHALRAAIAYASRYDAIQAAIQAAMEADAEPDGWEIDTDFLAGEPEAVIAYKKAPLSRGEIIEL
jgi:hypothetical protein